MKLLTNRECRRHPEETEEWVGWILTLLNHRAIKQKTGPEKTNPEGLLGRLSLTRETPGLMVSVHVSSRL